MGKAHGFAIAVLALAAGLSGCGTPGAPLPPSLDLPDRVANLAAVRAGNQVSLTWTMPQRNTDKMMLKENVAVRVCRELDASGCDTVGAPLSVAPGAQGKLRDTLSPALTTGAPRALSYFVELKNRNGRSAGLSNPAVVLAGEAPEPVTGLTAEVHKSGVVLHWTPRAEGAIRLHRTLLTPLPASRKRACLPHRRSPWSRTCSWRKGCRPDGLSTRHVRFGQTYEYRAQRVPVWTVDGKTLELAGALSAPVRVEARTSFRQPHRPGWPRWPQRRRTVRKPPST